MNAPVSVVIVSWNAERYLPECLRSLAALERPAADVVVVDSGSSDGSAALAHTLYPSAHVYASPENIGYCEGNNRGIRATSAPYVLVLNPDTILEPDFLERMLPAFDDPRVGIVAPKLLRFDRKTLDSAGQMLSRSRRPVDRGYGTPDRGQFDRDERVFGACGAAALYRRTMLDSIADPGRVYFDDGFFAFGEDLDVAWRAARRGWHAVYRPAAVGYHARGGSAESGPGQKKGRALLGRGDEVRYHVLKNRYLCILRNDTVAGYLANLPFVLARDLALLGLTLATSPKVLLRLWRSRSLFRRALERRRLDAERPRHDVVPG